MIGYRLTFDGPLRRSRPQGAFPRSDTLGAAVVHALGQLGEDASLVAAAPPFALSSCFPFTRRGSEVTYYWPVPMAARFPAPVSAAAVAAAAPGADSTALAVAAAATAARARQEPSYVSTAWFRYLLGAEGEPPPLHVLQEGALWSESPGPARVWSTEVRVRQPLDRLTSRPIAPPRRNELLRFSRGAGLFFLAQPIDDGARQALEAALRYLGDEGFGRTAPFTFEADEAAPLPGVSGAAEGGGYVLLSLYHPTREELVRGVLRDARYGFELRGGVHESGALRPALRMVVEGARLGGGADIPLGAAVEVAPAGVLAPHPVYRSGLALCAPAPKVAS